MMEKDKELLLSVHPSDSDEVIEEFKLPPPRTRRPKSRKSHHIEPRIASHGSSIISWKCCLLFLLASLFISGILVLTYFMLNMQQQINQMDLLLSKATADIKRHSAANLVQKKIIAELDGNKQKFSKQDLNNKLLAHQLNQMNKTLKSLKSQREYEQQLKTLNRDVDSIKTGMASTGGDIAKLQAQTKAHEAKLETSVAELKYLKEAIAKLSEINTLKELVHHFNQTLTENTQKIATQVYNSNVEMDDKSNELEVMIKGVNLTLHDALAKKISRKASVENATEAKSVMSNLRTSMNNMKDVIDRVVKVQFENNEIVKNMTNPGTEMNDIKDEVYQLKRKVEKNNFVSDMALVQSGLNNTREEISNLRLKVNNHHSLMEKMTLVQSGLNNTREEISNLKVKVNNHHSLMEEMISKVGNLSFNIKRIEHTRKVETFLDVPVETKTTSNVLRFVSTTPQVTEIVKYTTAEPVIGAKVSAPTSFANTSSTNVSSSGLFNSTNESSTKQNENETFTTTFLMNTQVISTPNPINKTSISNASRIGGNESALSLVVGNNTITGIKGNESVPTSGVTEQRIKDEPAIGNNTVTGIKGNESVPTSAVTEQRIKDEPAIGNNTITGIKGTVSVPTSAVTEQRIKNEPEVCPLRCNKHERCSRIGVSYNCLCEEGFLKIGKVCEDNNECYNSVAVCHINAICTNTIGSYSCQCEKGFQGNGTFCTQISFMNLNGTTDQNSIISFNPAGISQLIPNPTAANDPLHQKDYTHTSSSTNLTESSLITQEAMAPLTTDELLFPTREMPDELGRYPDPNSDVVATPEVPDEGQNFLATPEVPDEGQNFLNPGE